MTRPSSTARAARRPRHATWALLALALGVLAGCGDSDDDGGDTDAASEAPADDAAGDDTPAPDGATADATVVLDGEALPVHEVHCLEDGAMEHDSPSSVLADYVHPDDGEQYQFGVRNHGTSAAITVPQELNDPDEFEEVDDRDRWEAYEDGDQAAGGEELQLLDGVEYSYDGTAGSLELTFDAETIRMWSDPDYEGPGPRTVEFDITCP